MRTVLIQEAFYPNRITENTVRIKKQIFYADTEKAELLVFPAAALYGFQPLDLLKSEEYLKELKKAASKIIQYTTGLNVALVLETEPDLLSYIYKGKVLHQHRRGERNVFTFKNRQFYICFAEERGALDRINADICVAVDAKAFTYDKWKQDRKEFCKKMQKVGMQILYLNQCGGHEQYILQGASFAIHQGRKKEISFPFFEKQRILIELNTMELKQGDKISDWENISEIALIHDALVCGIKDYFSRCGAKTAILGLSGGIDSAVVLPLAVEALGRKNVFGLMMPSQFSSSHSVEDAVLSAEKLQIYYEIIPIEPIFKTYLHQLEKPFSGTTFGLAEENMQARIRGGLLMAMSNKFGHLLLNTSNKSESACGYGTLYGDLCGGLAIIADLYKDQVYELANYINRKKEIIPKNSIQKAPSAELRPDQKDVDSLPEYPILDGILRAHIEEGLSNAQLIKKGFPKAAVEKTLRLLYVNEYKRRQVAPALKISSTAFGLDRRMPILL